MNLKPKNSIFKLLHFEGKIVKEKEKLRSDQMFLLIH